MWFHFVYFVISNSKFSWTEIEYLFFNAAFTITTIDKHIGCCTGCKTIWDKQAIYFANNNIDARGEASANIQVVASRIVKTFVLCATWGGFGRSISSRRRNFAKNLGKMVQL